MKKTAYKYALLAALLVSMVGMQSCGNGNKDKTDAPETSTATAPEPTPAPAPVTVSSDEELSNKTIDALKDYPGVEAAISNGEVTLTGKISRSKLPKLMMAVNATQPKKVKNNLTITN